GLTEAGVPEEDVRALSAITGGGMGVAAFALEGSIAAFADMADPLGGGRVGTVADREAARQERMDEGVEQQAVTDLQEAQRAIEEREPALAVIPFLSSIQAVAEVNAE